MSWRRKNEIRAVMNMWWKPHKGAGKEEEKGKGERKVRGQLSFKGETSTKGLCSLTNHNLVIWISPCSHPIKN